MRKQHLSLWMAVLLMSAGITVSTASWAHPHRHMICNQFHCWRSHWPRHTRHKVVTYKDHHCKKIVQIKTCDIHDGRRYCRIEKRVHHLC